MKVYLPENVLDAALNRIRRIFDDFDNVIVNISGGKDSTVILNLALQIAQEKGRLPLKVLFIDQEAEWRTVIDYVRSLMNDPRVDPYWLQVPIKLFNATSALEPWLYCWEEGKAWMRDKELLSIHANSYGTDRFHALFDKFQAYHFPDSPSVCLTGVRAEESPSRLMGLTAYVTYADITWGKVVSKARNHFAFHPLYDWSYTDIWKAIHDHNWAYCEIYDHMYRHGVPLQKMRVSNLHHETAVSSLFFLQEVEGDTWELLTQRLSGIEVARHISERDMFSPQELPFMFASWKEYVDHLLDSLIPQSANRKRFRRAFDRARQRYAGYGGNGLEQAFIRTLLRNDVDMTILNNFESKGSIAALRKVIRHGGDLSAVKSQEKSKAVQRMLDHV